MPDTSALLPRSRDSRPFWDAIERHVFCVQVCGSCSLERWPPVSHCPRCASKQAAWRVLPGTGRVEGWATVHRSSDLRFAPLVPLTVIAARMDGAGGQMLFQTYALPAPPGRPIIGQTVKVDFARSPVGCLIPVFTSGDARSGQQPISIKD